jgi:hypothetical protein
MMKAESLRKIIQESLKSALSEADGTSKKTELIQALEQWADENGRVPADSLRDVSVEFGLDVDSDEMISAQIAVMDKKQTDRAEELTYDIKQVLSDDFPEGAPSFDEFYKVFQSYDFDNDYNLERDKIREKFTKLTTNPNQTKLEL